jgi:hypothetical protein
LLLSLPLLLTALGEGDDEDDDAEELALQGGEGRYADEAAVAAELKEMDEIYEVLAKVSGHVVLPIRPQTQEPPTHTCIASHTMENRAIASVPSGQGVAYCD